MNKYIAIGFFGFILKTGNRLIIATPATNQTM